jgi:hypothetical protein
MTLPIVLAIAGSIALLVGLFGGGIKAKEIEVPTLSTLPRILLTVFGIALIGTGITMPPQGLSQQPRPATDNTIKDSNISQPLEPTSAIDTYVDTPRVGVATSSCTDLHTWAPENGIDGDINTVWSSNGYDSPANTEWIVVNMGKSQNIGRIRVFPRDGGWGFPQDFKFQTSNDGTNWTDISGQSYVDYPNPSSAEQIFTFDPVIARYVRMYATKLGTDGFAYYFQLEDIFPQQIGK